MKDGNEVALIVLAAGAGTRMRSTLPKPLHRIAGTPMIEHVLRAGAGSRPVSTIVVLSPALAASDAWRHSFPELRLSIQETPLGTAHAVSIALPDIDDVRWLLVLFGDHPLLTGDTVAALVGSARSSGALVTMLTCSLDSAGAYGRVERDEQDRVTRVVERKDDDPLLREARSEINSGMMVLDAGWARDALRRIQPSPVTGEYYLPELIGLAVRDRGSSNSWSVQTLPGDPEDLVGVNDRIELANADGIMRRRIRRRHMLAGVTLIQPELIVIDHDVEIGEDTTIHPFSVLESGTRIGIGCNIGPYAALANATIGDGVTIVASTISDSSLAFGADAGPYAHLRNRTVVAERAHIGNFAEIKSSKIHPDVRVGHFSYIGDAEIGARSNVGAGTVTCNYDGVDKHRTEVGEDVFIGSDSMLVAPLTLGDRSRTGAGSVVTKNVPAGVTVVGIPARPVLPRHLAGVEAHGAEQGSNKE